jgi:anti-anti-sigma factor
VVLALSSTQGHDVVVVQARGELDVATAGGLWSHVSGWIERGQHRVLIDCTQLSFLDCFGLSALLRCSRAARLHGGWMRPCQVNIAVLRLLTIAGLAQIFVTEDEIRALMGSGVPTAPTSDARR